LFCAAANVVAYPVNSITFYNQQPL